MTLLTLFPTFIQLLMDKAFRYSQKWRFDYNETKSDVVTFGEHGPHHFREKNSRSWKPGDEVVEESNEYKNLGIVKNYVSSFQSDLDEAIEKNKKKGWNDFKWLYQPQKYKPSDIYIKLWRQACLPTLLFGSELWILRQTQILELERCQSWFLREVFHLPKFCDNSILTKISGLWSNLICCKLQEIVIYCACNK